MYVSVLIVCLGYMYVTTIVLFYDSSLGFLLNFWEYSMNIPLIDQNISRKCSLIDHSLILLT